MPRVAVAHGCDVSDRHAPARVLALVDVRRTVEGGDVRCLQTVVVDQRGRGEGLRALREAQVVDDAPEVRRKNDDRHCQTLPTTAVRERQAAHKHETVEVVAPEVEVARVALRLRNAIQRQLRPRRRVV